MKKIGLFFVTSLIFVSWSFAQTTTQIISQKDEVLSVARTSDTAATTPPIRLTGTRARASTKEPQPVLSLGEAETRAYLMSDAYLQAIQDRINMFREKGETNSIEILEAELKRVKELKDR